VYKIKNEDMVKEIIAGEVKVENKKAEP